LALKASFKLVIKSIVKYTKVIFKEFRTFEMLGLVGSLWSSAGMIFTPTINLGKMAEKRI
jgi:hypothetical protein